MGVVKKREISEQTVESEDKLNREVQLRLLLFATVFVGCFLFLSYAVVASFLSLPQVLPVIPSFDTTTGTVENLLMVATGLLVGTLLGREMWREQRRKYDVR